MKKVLLIPVSILMVLSLIGCSKKTDNTTVDQPAGNEPAETETDEPEADNTEPETTEEETPAVVVYEGETMQNGRIISAVRSEGDDWQVLEDSTADWRVTYIDTASKEYQDGKIGAAPTIQITMGEDSAERLSTSVMERLDNNEEKYTNDEIDYNGVHYIRVMPELGMQMMYADYDGGTVILTYGKNVDFDNDEVKQIIASIQVEPEE